MTVYNGTQFPEKYRGGMFVAFHGSWDRAPLPQAGYRVEFIPFDSHGLPTGVYEDFATGFPGVETFTNPNDAHYRPSGVAIGPDGSLYVCETQRGRVWRIIYTGDLTPPAGARTNVTAPAQNFPALGADTPGGKIYAQVCAACHMPNGSGVPAMQPPLTGRKVVAGNPARLIDVLLQGPAAVLPADREKFQNAMPPFGAAYNDADLASVINYLRKNFAPGTPEVTPAQVAAERAK
jgi:mono/diheme cytochrome c family protein